MTDLEEERRQNLASQFGSAATHSDFSIGQIIQYRWGGRVYSGEILWISGEPGDLGGDPAPRLRYIILLDGWPIVLTQGDILIQEPR